MMRLIDQHQQFVKDVKARKPIDMAAIPDLPGMYCLKLRLVILYSGCDSNTPVLFIKFSPQFFHENIGCDKNPFTNIFPGVGWNTNSFDEYIKIT